MNSKAQVIIFYKKSKISFWKIVGLKTGVLKSSWGLKPEFYILFQLWTAVFYQSWKFDLKHQWECLDLHICCNFHNIVQEEKVTKFLSFNL